MSKITIAAAAVALVAFAASPVRANIVQDPGFEDSGFGGVWTASPDWGIDLANPASGTHDASSGCFGPACVDTSNLAGASTLTQTLSTTPGQSYTLTFAFADGPVTFGLPTELKVMWDGVVVFDETDPTLTEGYSTYEVDNLVASSGSTELTFLAEQDDDFNHLDDIVVSAPEPASLSLLGVGLAALGLLRRRRRKS